MLIDWRTAFPPASEQLKIMRKNLPYLDQERLNIIFEHVYDVVSTQEVATTFNDEKLDDLLDTLQAMQYFNYKHRPDDTRTLFYVFTSIFHFEQNSEGATLWLSLILAIQEMYGFSEKKLVEIIGKVSVRK